MTICYLSNVIVCSFVIFNSWWKKVHQSINQNIVVFYFYNWKKESYELFGQDYLQMITQKIFLLLENLDQSKTLNIGLALILLIEIYSKFWILLSIVLHSFELIKLQLERNFLFWQLQIMLLYLQQPWMI